MVGADQEARAPGGVSGRSADDYHPRRLATATDIPGGSNAMSPSVITATVTVPSLLSVIHHVLPSDIDNEIVSETGRRK